MLTAEFDLTEFRSAAKSFDLRARFGVAGAVQAACEEGAAEARRAHRYKDRTGNLTRSIKAETPHQTTNGAEGAIVASAKYASFVEEGTRPHVIEARQAQALRFIWKGVLTYMRRVHHPGTKPAPFMGIAALKAERVLESRIEVALDEAAAVFA